MDLKEQGAEYEILSGQLCQEHIKKVCEMEVRHNAPHTKWSNEKTLPFYLIMDNIGNDCQWKYQKKDVSMLSLIRQRVY